MKVKILSLGIIALLIVTIPSAAAQNQAPVANAGADRNAYTGVALLLEGSAIDPDGDPIVSFLWVVDQKPPGGIFNISDYDRAATIFAGFVQGDYLLFLIACDATLCSAPDFVTVRVADNLAPVAILTAGATDIEVGGSICFDAAQSSDPEGGPLSYLWNFRDGSPLETTVAVCHPFTTAGTFLVTLQVIDELGASDSDVLVVTVQRIREIRQVLIDIKPSGDPNSINPRGTGTIPVAILSGPSFDAPIEVDTSSFTFGHGGNEESLVFCSPGPEDVNGDGLLDLVCHLDMQLAGFQLGDTEGILRGQLLDGTPIVGSDSVRIIRGGGGGD